MNFQPLGVSSAGYGSSKLKRKSSRGRSEGSAGALADADCDIINERTARFHHRPEADDQTCAHGIAATGIRARYISVDPTAHPVARGGPSRQGMHPSPTASGRDHSLSSAYYFQEARTALTSSASAMRPSKHRIERHRSFPATMEHADQSNNNNHDDDEDGNEVFETIDCTSEEGHETTTSRASSLNQQDPANRSTRAKHNVLPSRARRYRNLSAGATKKYDYDGDDGINANITTPYLPPPPAIADRPPSRQRHAFPTHLSDISGMASRGSRDKPASAHRTLGPNKTVVPNVSPTMSISERPPSRYMTKGRRKSSNHLPQNAAMQSKTATAFLSLFHDPAAECIAPEAASHGPSRRSLENDCYRNQAHHDPKTDGFADVDESVPPPFRIEITTNSAARIHSPRSTRASSSSPSPTSSPTPSSSGSSELQQHSRLQPRRWSSFSNEDQLAQMAASQQQKSDLSFTSSSSKTNPLQWFGKDDQINNAHLFETIDSMPSPGLHLADRENLRFSMAADIRSHLAPRVSNPLSRKPSVADPHAPTDDNHKWPEPQWIHQSIIAQSPSPEDMDPETAIAQTPLYEASDDLMAIVPSELSDLHLVDFIVGDNNLPASSSVSLHTSLGQDFLSLFAQH